MDNVMIHTILKRGTDDVSADINNFVTQRVSKLVDIKETMTYAGGLIIREFLILYIPKA